MDPSKSWMRNPFEVSLPVSQLSIQEQEQLIDLSSDAALQLQLKKKPLVDFWTEAMVAYPSLAKQAMKVLISFATTYLCESGFSALTAVKTKYRQRLHTVEKDAFNCLQLRQTSQSFVKTCRPTRRIDIGRSNKRCAQLRSPFFSICP
ncbi:hypothetical protein AALO_G00108910 [Alosa alosa]|uniref:HAT C-terminal dimerisation domain-containing protein n=1 Tax=Alosa alosa TaxID=278164 RepID=A0AAV6GUX3_9TELE|nr:hypothetical protein AALO_G00108910 [Alosa alosa]